MFSHNCCFVRQMFVAFIVLFIGSSFELIAQPQLKFDSISVLLPQITLQFKVGCSIVPKKSNYKIKEDGKDVTNFTLLYTDTTRQHCCSSTALVIDKSASMGWGTPMTGLDGAKQGAKTFINAMNGACDEATLVSFNTAVTVDVHMTSDKTILTNGVDGLSVSGNTAVWDAAFVGIMELANNATQPCRGIILLTDGEDNASANSVQDVISLAVSKGIAIYTIGLGNGINTADLQNIASSTGGTYIQTNDPAQLTSVFLSLYDRISQSGFYGQIIYNTTAKCLDGSTRTVDLTLDGAVGCPGTVTQTMKYKVSFDSSTFTPAVIKLDTVIAKPGDLAGMLLSLETDINDLFEQSRFTIQFDPSCANFVSITTTGFLLNGVGIDATPVPGGYTFGTTKQVGPVNSGILAWLKFLVQPGPDRECPITITSWIFSKGCIKPVLFSGLIIVKNHTLNLIAPNGGERLCWGATHRITWNSNNINLIRIYLSNNGGTSYIPIADSIDAQRGYWDWYILPGIAGTQYRIQIRDENTGTILSASASDFIIDSPPYIKLQPINQTACAGDSVSFMVSVTTYYGIQIPGIQWQVKSPVDIDFADIAGATDSTLTLRNISYSQDMSLYRAHILNSCADVYSDSAMLILTPAPAILSQPQSQDVCFGSPVNFSVAVSGTNILYQWRKDGIPINFATQNSYTISSVSVSDLGNYDVTIFGTCSASSITSTVAQLRSTPLPQITVQPRGDTVCAGKSVSFTVTASGKSLTYQWRKSGVPITGAISPAYTIISVINIDSGLYDVAVTDSCGVQYVVSNPAPLLVNTIPVITNQPANQNLCEGSTATFTFTGTGATTLQWLKNGNIIPGATSNILTFSSIQQADTGSYSVLLINDCGQILSASAYLSIAKNTAITTQPVSQTVNQNNSVTFSVAVIGSNLTYQWQKNGIDIPGATSSSYTISSAKKSDEGNYSVVVTGQCGPAVQSNIVSLSVTLVDVKQTSSPASFYLGQNYPNPFERLTIVDCRLTIERKEKASFKIYDIFGREVLDLSKEVFGNSSLTIDNSQLPSQGIYFYRLTIGNESQTKMMMLIK